MSANLNIKIEAPEIVAALDKLVTALSPKTVTVNQQFPARSPAEQAARMRTQPAPAARRQNQGSVSAPRPQQPYNQQQY